MRDEQVACRGSAAECHGVRRGGRDSARDRLDGISPGQPRLHGGGSRPGGPGGRVCPRAGHESEAKPRTLTVLVLDSPGVSQAAYAVTGQVRCDSVGGEGYLEMWSLFPGGGRYFSRTMASQGPMARLHGTAGWRRFVLPFQSKAGMYPSKLVINVVLPRGGTVELGPLKLMQYGPGEDPLREPGEPHFGVGLVVMASVYMLGPFSACSAVSSDILSSMGKHRRLVMGLTMLGIVGGAAMASDRGRLPGGPLPVLAVVPLPPGGRHRHHGVPRHPPGAAPAL